MTEHKYVFQGPVSSMQLSHCTVYVQGVVEKLTLEDCHVQVSGIVKQRYDIASKRIFIADPPKPANDNEVRELRREIEELRYNLRISQTHEEQLRTKIIQLKESGLKEPEPSDDVLVQRIRLLQSTLDVERENHRKEISELKDRLDVAMEINTKLRQHNDEVDSRSQNIADNHIDILATMMAAYPFTPDKDLEFEFGIPINRIRETARVLGLIKSPEARREAADYLQRQHRELIQRRGGDQGNHNTRPVEKVAKYGRLIASYDSVKEAARENGMWPETVRKHCNRYYKPYKEFTKDGFTFRYKKNEDKVST